MSLPTLTKNYFLVVAYDQPDSGTLRAKHTPEHMAYNQPFIDNGYLGTLEPV